MDPKIVRYVHELSAYVKELKNPITKEFPEAQFGRVRSYMDPDCTCNRRDHDFWQLPVYTYARDMDSVLNLAEDRVAEIILADGVHILVMPENLSDYQAEPRT